MPFILWLETLTSPKRKYFCSTDTRSGDPTENHHSKAKRTDRGWTEYKRYINLLLVVIFFECSSTSKLSLVQVFNGPHSWEGHYHDWNAVSTHWKEQTQKPFHHDSAIDLCALDTFPVPDWEEAEQVMYQLKNIKANGIPAEVLHLNGEELQINVQPHLPCLGNSTSQP